MIPRFLLFGLTALASVVVAPATASANGHAAVLLIPGATRDQVLDAPASWDLPTWELPEGLLVVDRRGWDGAPTLQGQAFAPQHPDSEWYLVYRPHLARGRYGEQAADPARFGHVHHAGATAWVVEVPRERLDDFYAAAFRLHYLDRTLVVRPRNGSIGARTGAPAATNIDEAMKAAYIDGLEQQSYDLLIREITGDTSFALDGGAHTVSTRYFNTAGNNLVAAYLAQKLADWGYAVELDTFMVGSHICRNVVATKLGTTTPEEIVVVGGHYDSTSQQPGSLAPGAEDNASGTSLVMEIARISADRQFERTVRFVLFDAEEVGLRGSIHFVDDALAAGREIIAAITADMVAYYQSTIGVIIEGQTPWEWLMQLMAANVEAHTDIVHRKDYHSWGSDHVPFQQAGIAAFLAIDWDWSLYPYYHRTTDTWLRIAATAHLGLEITRAAAATLADVAGLLPATTSTPATPPVSAALVYLAAHPNPFNPQITFTFSLAEPAAGELAVFDLSGRRLATPAAGDFAAGRYTARWDGLDRHGRALPSGVYVGRLRTSAGSASVKLNLVR